MAEASEQKNVRLLKKVPFFEPLDQAQLLALLPFLQEKRYKKSEIIFHEGEPGRYLFLIRSGNVKVYKLSQDGKEKILRVFGPGDFFAELPLLDGGNYPATAETLCQTTLVRLSREDFLRILAEHPRITSKIYQIVGERLRHFTTAVTDLTLKDATRRLAGFLLQKAQENERFSSKEVRFPLELTHQEIASLVGTARETVSRTLRLFQKQGIIEIKDRYLTVLDKESLARAAE